jgi:hypothetical protein
MPDHVTTVVTPDISGVVDRQIFQRPLGGPRHPLNYLDRFPETVYDKSPDSHLVKLLYSLLGPAGIGWLRKNYLETRLQIEDYGLENFALDQFYGNPIKFGRILEEINDENLNGLIPHERWEEIKAKNARYRGRAIDYVTGARAGNTPRGMRLVARSGLGHEVEIIENYKHLYDNYSDDPLNIAYYGKTRSTEEMVVLPRREVPQSETQVISLMGSPTGGFFTLYFEGSETANIAFDATRYTVQLFLESLPSIKKGQVDVKGGPFPNEDISVNFINELSYRDVPLLRASNQLTGGADASILINTEVGGFDAQDSSDSISPRDQHYLQEALGRIKPMTAIVTYGSSPGLQRRQNWNTIFASSRNKEVQRYVTGKQGVSWPIHRSDFWIREGVEKESQRIFDDLHYHYQGFHNVISVIGYTEEALNDPLYNTNDWLTVNNKYRSEHIGVFSRFQQFLFNVLATNEKREAAWSAPKLLADYAEPLTIRSTSGGGDTPQYQYINGIYPLEYQSLPNVSQIKYPGEQFWASLERDAGTDYIELNLGAPKPINYLSFEITRKPFDISVDYDVLGMGEARDFRPIDVDTGDLAISFDSKQQNPWQRIELRFTSSINSMIFTKFVRIGFTRRAASAPFLSADGTVVPHSIECRNLRIGRNVS